MEDDEDDIIDDNYSECQKKDTLIQYGLPGSKAASVLWFKATQVDALRDPRNRSRLYPWFHGIISRGWVLALGLLPILQ